MGRYRFLKLSVLLAAIAVSLHSQTQVDLRTQTKSVDFSQADSTKPAKSGTSLPANCSVGEVFFKTDEPAGSNLYGCTSVDVWTLLSGQQAPVDSVFGRTGAVTAASGDYSASQVENTPAGGIAATDVQSAINELDSEKAPTSHTHSAGAIDDGGAPTMQALFSGGAGNAGFRAITDADVPNDITIDLAGAASSLAADPADCAAGDFATAIDALGNLSCAAPAGGGDVTGPAIHSDSFVPQWDGANTKQLKNGIAVASMNTANTLVQRDASGNFTAGTITATLSGNASTATAMAANPADCPGGEFATAIDASGNLSCAVPPGGGDVAGPAANTDNFVPQWNGANSKTLKDGLQATPANTASALVQRDGSGNFAAGTITGALIGNASTATALAANPANCTGNQFPKGVTAAGAAEGCTLLADADIPDTITRDSEINVQGMANEISSSGTGPAPTLSIASTFDISGKTSTSPIKKGTTLPASCTVGQYFMDTDATPGQNTYACTATDTWTLQGDGGSDGWRCKTITESDLTDADTSEDETLFSAVQREKIHAVTIKHSAAFTGGALSAMTVSVGCSGIDPEFYAAPFDIFQAPGDTVFLDQNVFGSCTMAPGGHTVIVQFNSEGANVAGATAGSVEICVLTTVLP